jgi:hypothetical protein
VHGEGCGPQFRGRSTDQRGLSAQPTHHGLIIPNSMAQKAFAWICYTVGTVVSWYGALLLCVSKTSHRHCSVWVPYKYAFENMCQ